MWRLIFELLIFAFMVSFAIGGLSAAPWVPARKKDIARFMEAGAIQPGDVVVDLGCGDGRILFAAMKRGASRAVGYEISLLPLCIAYARLMITPKKLRPQIYFKNFWHADVHDATVVYTFLMPASFSRLLKKLQTELPPRARLVNYVWPIPSLTPDAIFEAPASLKLYRYQLHTDATAVTTPHTL